MKAGYKQMTPKEFNLIKQLLESLKISQVRKAVSEILGYPKPRSHYTIFTIKKSKDFKDYKKRTRERTSQKQAHEKTTLKEIHALLKEIREKIDWM